MSPDARTDLDALTTSPKAARDFVRAVLDAWDCDDPHEIALLLTSEVVSNAVLHAATRLALDVGWDEDAGVLRIEVRDGSPDLPEIRVPAPDATGGRGILLLERLARRWGARPEAEGKVVWFELAARRRGP